MSTHTYVMNIAWPRKIRDMHNHHMDSTRWDDIAFRDGDIVIATWAKSGTSWTQQIVGQLVFAGAEDVPILDISPWVDLRFLPWAEIRRMLEAQPHRRIMKTHLPIDALAFSPHAKYIYIGRDGRDVLWSVHNHHMSATDNWYAAVNDTPGRIGPPIARAKENVRDYFHDWLDGDGFPFWPFWSSVQSWWDIRALPNVLLVHFNELKADMPGAIRRIAAFLDIDVAEALWPTIIEHCSFDYMRNNAQKLTPMLKPGELFINGGESFIHKGTNGRWRDVLTADDIRKYQAIANERLSPECARWLATGER